jgi:hypothetical protein
MYVAETALLKICELVKYSSKSASLSDRYGWRAYVPDMPLLAAVQIPFAKLLKRRNHATEVFLDAEERALAQLVRASTNQPD